MKSTRITLGLMLVALILLTSCGNDKPITVAISPSTVTMDQGASQSFTAAVTGSRNTAVVWSVSEANVGGNISPQGVYTAPGAAGTYHIVATSAADSGKTAICTVIVRQVALSPVSPNNADLAPGASHQFTVTVTGSVNQSVNWSVQEGAVGGSITAQGLYTAPATTGTFHVVATSAADSTKTVTVAVTVTTPAVSISPHATSLLPGAARAFSASVAGSMDDRVTWAVQEGSAGGVITGEGAYTAPAAVGEYHVIATSVAYPSVFGIATVIVSNSGFIAAGQMMEVRFYHSATRLSNGDVLLAGGSEASGHPKATAELFDHTTGSFRATSAMADTHSGHTATLLQNERVLIAGGNYNSSAAEEYDPATGQFAVVGAMGTVRYDHTATLLLNGKVLITGGNDFWDEFETAELYDPETRTFAGTGSMQYARSGHTATLLPDGRVLIVGGWSAPPEIYDPNRGVFNAAVPSAKTRYYATATLLPAGVLVTGGEEYDVLTMDTTRLDDAEMFDVVSGTPSALAATMNHARSRHTATLLLDGQVLLTGGWTASNDWNNTAELFNPATSLFLPTGDMAQARYGHTATLLLDGRVLVVGGVDDKAAEFYVQQP